MILMMTASSRGVMSRAGAAWSTNPIWLQRATFRIYTRTGDKGSSSLYNGQRRSKDDAVFAALGDTDELNAALGLAQAHCALVGGPRCEVLLPQISHVQSRLLDVGSAIATPLTQSSEAKLSRAMFDDGGSSTATLERWIDEFEADLPPLRNFILPGGGLASASLHSARATCRRAERAIVPLVRDGECDSAAQVYINRLSDYLFNAARFVSTGDEVYQKNSGKS
jgi:cob(I)alamin adenosyltransferase